MTRQIRIKKYVEAYRLHAGWAMLTAAVFGPLGYCYVRPAVGGILTAFCLALLAWWTRLEPLYLHLYSPVVFIVGAVWVACLIMAPLDAQRHNTALQAHAELIAAFDPREG